MKNTSTQTRERLRPTHFNPQFVPRKVTLLHFLLAVVFILQGCKKQDNFLNAKTNSALIIPKTLDDYQALIQNEGLFTIQDPGLGQICTDEFYVTSANWAALTTTQEINGYIFGKQVYTAGGDVLDWSTPYIQVYYANTVLDALAGMKINSADEVKFQQIKGIALFRRSWAFYNLLQTFAKQYDPKSAATDPGIPLQLTSELTVKIIRSPVADCYGRIISDLESSISLLQDKSVIKTIPSKATVYGLLARINLALGNYEQAKANADNCLAIQPELTDYNAITPTDYTISNGFLSEDIYHSSLSGYYVFIANGIAITDSALYASYKGNDLRKSVNFIINDGLPYFRGTYDFKGNMYSGIAADEIYLIRAECRARLGDKDGALNDLNKLLVTRWKTGTFLGFSATSAQEALKLVLQERKKELLFRGIRWTDMRRLNKDPAFSVTLNREINGVKYVLPPNDNKYVWPIPDNEIKVSGIQQNPR